MGALTLPCRGVRLARLAVVQTDSDTIFQVLGLEHRELEAWFASLYEQATIDFEAVGAGYPQLALALIAHLHAEAAVLFPRLAAIPDLAPLLAQCRADHARIEADALTLGRELLTPSEWLRGLRRLELDVEHLIEREETYVFPIARRALPLDQSHALATELRSVREITQG